MKRIIPTLLLGLVAAASMQAYATPILTTIQLNTVFTGATPDGSPPWLTATFTSSTGSSSGILTLTSHLSGTDFLQGLNSPKGALGWGFYLNTGIASVTCSSSPGNNCTTKALSGGSYNAGSLGKNWNLAFGWPVKNRFVSGNTAVYDITFISALMGSPFVVNPDPKAAGALSVAHVQGISTGTGSSWIGTGMIPPTNVPEPAVLGMFGLGTLLIGLFAGLRRRP